MNKKALYESIMKNVAKQVKKTLNENEYPCITKETSNKIYFTIEVEGEENKCCATREEFNTAKQIFDNMNGWNLQALDRCTEGPICIGNVAAALLYFTQGGRY